MDATTQQHEHIWHRRMEDAEERCALPGCKMRRLTADGMNTAMREQLDALAGDLPPQPLSEERMDVSPLSDGELEDYALMARIVSEGKCALPSADLYRLVAEVRRLRARINRLAAQPEALPANARCAWTTSPCSGPLMADGNSETGFLCAGHMELEYQR